MARRGTPPTISRVPRAPVRERAPGAFLVTYILAADVAAIVLLVAIVHACTNGA
jgi:hypothetical protein